MITKEELFEMQNKKFNWLGKGKERAALSDADLSISKCKGGPKDKSMRFSFVIRNKYRTEFGTHIDVCIYKNRVFFRDATGNHSGYKISDKNNKVNRYFSIAEKDDTYALNDFIGNWKLEYDKFYELYYIENPNINED